MNPQQFQNMAGMGRGMPNMNPNLTQQRGPPNFLQIIYQNLTQSQNHDGPFQDWRSTVSIQERANQIKLLFDSLRILSSTNDIIRSLDIALAFERKQFISSPTLEAYKHSIREKLFSIKDQRQQHVNANTNLSLGNMQMGQNAGFQQQQQQQQAQQQQTQLSQMGQAMNFGQPGIQPSPMMNQMPGQQNMNPNQSLNQQTTHNNALNQPNRTGVPDLSKEDNTWINARAAEMAKSTPREQMREIVESMDPRIRMNLQEKKIDPIIYHFRMKATREFRLKQQHQNQQQQAAAANQPNNVNFNTTRRNTTPTQNMGLPVSQPNSTAFIGNIDQIRDQQEEGMRSQQQGQLVVPANTGSDVMRAQQQMIANQMRKQYPHATPHQLSQLMRQRMAQVQQQQLQRQMQANGQAGVMPNVGPGQNLNQGVSQPTMGMSTLTQPVNHSNGSPAQSVPRPASRVQGSQMAGPGQQQQQPASQQPQPPQPQQGISMAQIQQNFSRLPPALQQKLRSTPNQADWVGIVNQWRAAQAQLQRQQMQPNANDMRRTASQQTSQNFQQVPNPQFGGPSPMRASLSTGAEQNNAMQSMTPMQRPVQTINPNLPNGLPMQTQPQQRPPSMPMPVRNPMNQQDPNMKMVQALVQESENYPVPTQVLAKLHTIYMQGGVGFPQIQSWGQLKQFVKTHPNQQVHISALLQTQVVHARSVKQQANIKQENMTGMLQGVQPQMPGGVSGMQQVVGGQGIRGPVTQQDVQRMKAQNPNYAHLSDNQVRDMLTQKLNAQKPPQQPGPPATNMSTGQNSGPPANQAQNNARAPNQALPKAGPPAANNRPQPPNQVQNPNHGQNQVQAPITTGPKPAENKLKRPNQDESQGIANMPQRRFDITKAEFESYTPEQKEKYMQDRKKMEATMKMAKMRKYSQEIQAAMAHRRPPLITNMDPQSRQTIINMLTSENTRKILERFDSFLLAFDQSEKDENMLKALMQHRWHLMQQFKPESWADKSYQPADHFTLQVENIEKILSTVSSKFQQAIQKSHNQTAARPQLTQENLMTAATQAAQQQKLSKNKSKDGPPPAPTVDKPPFQFPDDRGRGTPKYATPGIKQEDLKLPPNKRLKGGPPTPSTPVQAPLPKPTFRCSISGCSVQPQGFNTQAELEAHRNMAHQELAVKDPIGFLNSSLQQSFNLDVNMESKKVKGEQATVSTPMVKAGSQQDNKAALQAQPMIKSETQVTKNATKALDLINESLIQDEWDDTTFTFDDLTNVFGTHDHADIVSTQQDSFANSMRAIEAYMGTDEWKQAIGVYNSSEDSSNKSKSPDRGSEQSLPTKTQNEADKDPFYVDLAVDGNALPVLEGNFEDLFVNDDLQGGDWTMLDAEGSLSPWEKIDGSSEGESKKKYDTLIIDLDQANGDGFPDDEIDRLLDEKAFEAMLATNDPGVYAAGSMEWNAIGKTGEEMRRALGWPIEGAAGRARANANSER